MERVEDKSRIPVIIIVILGFLVHFIFLSGHIDKLIAVNYKNELSSLNDAAVIVAGEADYYEGEDSLKYAKKNKDVLASSLKRIENSLMAGNKKKAVRSKPVSGYVQKLTDNFINSSENANVYDFKKDKFLSLNSTVAELIISPKFKTMLNELKSNGSWSGSLDEKIYISAHYYENYEIASFIITDHGFKGSNHIQEELDKSIISNDGVYIFHKSGRLLASNKSTKAVFEPRELKEKEYEKRRINLNGKTIEVMSYSQISGDFLVITTKTGSDINIFSFLMKTVIFVFLVLMVGFAAFFISTVNRRRSRDIEDIYRSDERFPEYVFNAVSALVLLFIISLSGIFVSQTLNLYFNNLFREALERETISVSKEIERNKIILDGNVDRLIKSSKDSLEATVQTVSSELDYNVNAIKKYKTLEEDNSRAKVFLISKNEMLWKSEYRYIRDRYGGKKGIQCIETGVVRNGRINVDPKDNDLYLQDLRQTALAYNKNTDVFVVAERILDREYIDKTKIAGNLSIDEYDGEGNAKNSIHVLDISGKILSSSSENKKGNYFFAYGENPISDSEVLLKNRNAIYDYKKGDDPRKKVTIYISYTDNLGKYIVGAGSYDVMSDYNYSFSRSLTLLTMTVLFISVLSLAIMITIRTGKMV